MADVHDSILDATCDLVHAGGHNPTQLLALQRLADFPEVADYRAHKIEMDLHRKQMAIERLEIQKRRLQLAENAAKTKQQDEPKKQEDHLGPLATNWKEVGERVRKQFDISPEEAARRAELRKTWKRPDIHPTPSITPPNQHHNSPGEHHLGGNNPVAGFEVQSSPINEQSTSSTLNP